MLLKLKKIDHNVNYLWRMIKILIFLYKFTLK